ncbi:MAG: ribosomal RNA small subunit methyltransferase A [Chlamydiales bacterium]|nr:ribosomal RNA small subunit methyltransferase A [Chlamydiales bacterium]
MKPHRLSELQKFLTELGLNPKKRFSQNFLVDGNILRKLVEAAQILPGDEVIEIGPGPGALTRFLLEKGAHVTAIEIDRNFAEALRKVESPHLTVFEEDFMKFPLDRYLDEKGKPLKVVANLPYHITTPILTKLLPLYPRIESVTIMVQKEFGRRMVATPSSEDYSSFSLFTRFYSDPAYCFTVEPTCFYPRPRVQSAVIHCHLKPPPLDLSEEEAFFSLTRRTFQKKRKMLKTSLKDFYPIGSVEAALAKMGLSVQARPEELSLEQFLYLFAYLKEVKGRADQGKP